MSEQPLVSILIPCFNAEKWVGQSVQSALSQSYPNKEVIVDDDGSTDGSLQILKGFGDAIHLETGPNRGGNAARNRLLALSRGQWLQYLDADDFLRLDKVEGQLNFAVAHPQLDVIYSPMYLRDETTGIESRTFITNKSDPFCGYLCWLDFCTHSILLRRSAIEAIGGWNESQRVCQEHELILRLLLNGAKFGLHDQLGAVYRHHGNDTVSKKSPERTIRQRMLLTERLADHLRSTGNLTPARKEALARSQLEAARSMYRWDKNYAREQIRKAIHGRPIPHSPASPLLYRLALRLLGFEAAERLAALKRKIRPATQQDSAGQ